MDMKQQLAQIITQALADCYAGVDGLPDENAIIGFLEVPPEKEMGDYAFPCFKLSRALHMGPPQIAGTLAAAINAPDVCEQKQLGGYLNFFLHRDNFARDTLRVVLDAGERYGASDVGKGKTVCLDYSSINIAKRFHIGHLSTTMLGHSLKRIYDFLGYTTVGINHLGDWGTQFGKMLCAYEHWGDHDAVEKGGVDELTRLYVRFHKEAEANPALEDEGRAWFKRIEDGDEEALALFNWFKELTLKDAARVYDILGVKFDSYAGESFYNDKMGRVIDELTEKGLLQKSEGASVVDLEPYGMPPCLILKKDGATLYATRDIAAALYRADTYHFDKCLYVVAYQQDLHFRQWFKVVELMGYPWAKDLIHVAFGMISYEGQTLSTRKGNILYLEDVLARAQEKALAIIEEKSPNLENKAEVARQVGIGAVVYADLQNNRIKDIDFWWDRALNFDGETGPYVQYTHARCCSALRKAAAQGVPETPADYAGLSDDWAQELLRQLSRFPETVLDAADKNEPSMITRAMTDIAKAYNKFYYENRILDAEPGVRQARLELTLAAKNVLKTAMFLIGMEAPERM
ncbi:MAG: arginine--tRNA ligase [Eubacteriales bacterium]|nr:arginine--tRNA ligase [Eubacteriales bacterium]